MASFRIVAGLGALAVVRALDIARFSLNTRGDGFVTVPVVPLIPSGLQRRAIPTDDLTNEKIFYAIDVELGTPPQLTTVLLDTGSAELWVDPDCSGIDPTSTSDIAECTAIPKYIPADSSTAEDLGVSETLNYGDASDPSSQTSVTIEYFTDTLTIGGAGITSQIFGVATASQNIAQGILGVGPDVTYGFSTTDPYSLVLDTMAAEGVINSRALSLDLRGQNDPDGTIIFGGLDKGKFEGTLKKLPIIPADESPDGAWRYYVSLTSLGSSVTAAYSVPAGGLAVFLDSGNTYSRLPQDLAQAIYTDLNGVYDSASGLYQVDCALRSSDGTISFGFGDKVIDVTFSDFIQDYTFSDGSHYCAAGVIATSSAPVLGDSFLRAAYAVFDWDNQNIHLAQAADCGSDVVAITTGPDAVPSVTGCGSSPSGTSSASFTPSGTPSNTATESATPTPTPTESSTVTVSPSESASSSAPEGPTTSAPTYTSTFYLTSTYTITSCPVTITDCPVGHETTETITSYTTWCPGEETFTSSIISVPTTTGAPGEICPGVCNGTETIVTTPIWSAQPTLTPTPSAIVTAGAQGRVVSMITLAAAIFASVGIYL